MRTKYGIALLAGIGLAAMALLGGFANFVVLEGLVTPGDPARTAADVLDSEGLYRLGIASFCLVVVLDIVVAWALYRLFEPVDRAVSMLAAWFRVAYAAVFLTAIAQLVAALSPLTDAAAFGGFTEQQRQALALSRIDTFDAIWSAGLAVFGLHLVVVGSLALRSTWVPRLVGVLVCVAGAGYVVDSAAKVLVADPPFEVAAVTFVGEIALMLWLLVAARRHQSWTVPSESRL
ncbi:DUF4386 domain-containing protein [Jiangella mangrovi]|uniref:DUF4386 domain-containing protein n=1 Tax=Jiangella mangrovi TaxID=1524084 RepID=A0A7W9LJN9_9ACTN|nr:DUF4386 domain-containing protein [Jiangella mangrovi]MBB5786281.1 hypothetical protein [Jiangella mangrovi]